MIQFINLFDNNPFSKRLNDYCSTIDPLISVVKFEASDYFSNPETLSFNKVLLVNKVVLDSFHGELEQSSATNAIVYIYETEEEVLYNKELTSIIFTILPTQFTMAQAFNLIHLCKKQLVPNEVSSFLVNSSFSEIDRLLSSLSVGLFWKNTDLQYIGCNQKFADDLSMSIPEIIGKKDSDFNDDKIAQALSENDEKLMISGEPDFTIEKEILFKNGLKKWLRVSKFPYRSANGNIVGIVGVYRWFIDKHRRTTDAFSEHNLLQILLDNIPDTIYLKDKESRFVLVNKALSNLIGLNSPDEAIGKTDFDFFDTDHANEAYNDEQHVIENKQPLHKSELIRNHENRLIWVNTTKLPIKNEQGEIVGTAGISRDIDKLVRTKQTLKAEKDILQVIIDNIPSPIYFKNKQSVFTRANKALLNLLGIKCMKDLLGKTDFSFYPEEDAKVFFNEEQNILKTGEPLMNKIENSIYEKESVKWMSTTKIPIKNKKGEYTGIVGISHDITEQILVKQRLEYARQKAEEANKAKSNFLSNMSHEIRTPLNGIIGMADVLNLTELTDDQQKIVNILMRSGNNLLNIINDILDFSKIESGKMELDIIEMNIENLLDDVVDLMQYHAKEKKLEICARFDKNLPSILKGDPYRLKQILLNLVNNAIKFTEHGEINIEVMLKGNSSSKHWVQFKVTDTGIGMDITDVERIFESFTQADASTTRKYGGTGLGLAICNRLVMLMGGKLNVLSKKGEGSVFYFDLMLDKVSVNEPNLL